MSDSNVLSPDFREFVGLLNQHDVKYLITGGYAVGIYGYPRYTGDLDIWVKASLDNGEKLVKVFDAFDLGSFEMNVEDFTKPEQIIQIGYPPFRIDILTSIDGVEFDEAFPNVNVIEIDDIPVNFISLPDLRKNKIASGRRRDIDDLENMEERE